MCDSVTFRKAKPDEAAILSALAMRSKAYWGYSDEFLAACRQELTVTPARIRDGAFHFVVAERDGEMVGFVGVERLSPLQFELEALFVEPDRIGTGIGRALMERAKEHVVTNGGGTLWIQSDPNAEKFYRAAGGQLVDKRQSASIPGRFLSVFAIAIPQKSTQDH